MRRPRAACDAFLAGLLFWSAVHAERHHGLPQHRVKRTGHKLKYHNHERESDAREPFSKFWIPPRSDDGTEATRRKRTRRESSVRNLGGDNWRGGIRIEQWHDNDERVWSLHGDASFQSPEDYYRTLDDSTYVRRRASFTGQGGEYDEPKSLNNNSSEFPEDESPGEANGWNLTTEVEYDGPSSNATNHTNATSSVVTSGTPVESNETEAEQTIGGALQPIRIRAILSEQNGGQFLEVQQREVLFQRILSPALLAWSSALRVTPVLGNLTLDREQLYDGATCGPGLDSGYPSVPVPLLHFTEGIPETDLILYLSLGFVAPNEASQRQPPTESPPRFPGMDRGENSPFLSWWSMRPSCSGDYVAAASYCSTDQYDRPTAALLHLCIDDDFFNQEKWSRDVITVMHELGHALGFNSQSLAYFRHPDGTPITRRNKNDDVEDSEVECTGPSQGRVTASVPLPSDEILQFRMVRGVRVAEIVTPSVRQVIRNHFNCQELPGAELESGLSLNDTDEEGLSACIGNHWERRVMRTDLMNSLIDEVPFSFRISPLTLALFADSGWYQVDLSRAQFSSGWGRNAGCSFVEDPCVTEEGEVSAGNRAFFCDEEVSSRIQGTVRELNGCSADLSRKAVCSISEYSLDIPTEYQYFNDRFGSHYGGSEPLIDFCPVYTGFANGLCKAEENQDVLRVSKVEEFGKRNSRCVSGLIEGSTMALCLPIACVIQDRSLRIKTDRSWQTCLYAGQRLTLDHRSGDVVTCPDPRSICPTFYCRRDCLGTGGVCDYTSGECLCNVTTINGTTMGQCGAIYSEDQVAAQVFHDDVAQEASPLSDYYYASPEKLDDDDGRMKPVPRILLFILGCIVGVLGLLHIWKFRNVLLRPFREALTWIRKKLTPADPPPNNDDIMQDKAFANKDIMIASMLVDMRIHHPQLELEASSDLQFFKNMEASAVSVTESEDSSQVDKSSEFESVPDEENNPEPITSDIPEVETNVNRTTAAVMRRRRKT